MNNIVMVFLLISSASFSDLCKELDEYCHCDDKCAEYGDCCPGHRDFGKIGLLNNISICTTHSQRSLSRFWVINGCKNPHHHLANYCSKIKIPRKPIFKSFIPVIANSSRIYENIYCAECNGETEFRYLNVSIECNSETQREFLEVNRMLEEDPDKCDILPNFNEIKERTCFPDLIRSCPMVSNGYQNSAKDNCSNGNIAFAYYGKNFYRNMYCCHCWGVTCQPSNADSIPPKFTYLLNFNEWQKNGKEALENETSSLINLTNSKVVNDIVFYTSFIFICLSMVSLSFLMFLYTTQQVFHNFGGYLTICLSICQWIMHFLLLLVSNSRVTESSSCKFVSILQHFIALSTFIWMALYALDLLQTFGFKTMKIKRKTWKTFVVYCAIGFCCSAGFVVTSAIIDFTVEENSIIRPQYGGVHCWFTNKTGGIIWYFVPVCLLLFWNFGTCVVVFYRLMGTANDTRVAQQNESKSTLWLCIRLTAVFGIGYVFQIIVILSHVESLITLGSIINCLQGFLLTICFGCTKRVHSAMKKTLSSVTDNISKSFNQGQQQNTQISSETQTFHSTRKT